MWHHFSIFTTKLELKGEECVEKKVFNANTNWAQLFSSRFFFFYVLKWDMHNNLVLHTAAPIIVMLTVQIYSGWDTQSQPLAAQARCPPHREGDDGEQTANN